VSVPVTTTSKLTFCTGKGGTVAVPAVGANVPSAY